MEGGRQMNRLTPALAALVLVAVGFTAVAATRSSETTGVVRYEKTIVDSWHFGCHGDACQGGPSPFEPIVVTSPTAEETVDVVATVTMDYATTPWDFGVVGMRLDPSGAPAFDMKPGWFPLNSRGVTTTTSVSWIARDVPSAGDDLDLQLRILPRKGSPDDHFHIAGKRFTVVIEIWSAG